MIKRTYYVTPDHSSAGRAEDCRVLVVILRSLVQFRLVGVFIFYFNFNQILFRLMEVNTPINLPKLKALHKYGTILISLTLILIDVSYNESFI